MKILFASMLLLVAYSSPLIWQGIIHKNQINGKVMGQVGSAKIPLRGITVKLYDLKGAQLDFVTTGADGSFSIIVPEEQRSFRLVLVDDSVTYWAKQEDFTNDRHPHDVGSSLLHSISDRLTSAEIAEQTQIVLALDRADRPAAEALASKLALNSCESGVTEAQNASVVRAAYQTGIPQLLKSRIAANQASAVGSLRTLVTSQVSYQSTYGTFADSLSKLGEPPAGGSIGPQYAGFIDRTLALGIKSGYVFSMTPNMESSSAKKSVSFSQNRSTSDSFGIRACPLVKGKTGDSYYFTDQSGVIRFGFTPNPSSSNTTPLQ